MSETEAEIEVPSLAEPVVESWAEPRWEGHDHDYPDKPRQNGTKVCRECGYVCDVTTPGDGLPIDPEETP